MILKRGMSGEAVRQVQVALGVTADGKFGVLTEQAVKDFQRKNGLVVDGIVGDKTLSLLLPKSPDEAFIVKGYINTNNANK
jgi:peptidoglycan hydrolase-like protein with peptidoglycan-binding domain